MFFYFFCVQNNARQLSLSSTRSAAEFVKPPIQIFGIEGRYAHAVYSAAAKSKQLETVESELKNLESMMKKSERLSDFIVNPTMNKTKKQSGLTQLLKDQKFSDLTINLLSAMAENNRLGYINSVANAFSKIMSAARGEIICSVTSAKPLDASHMKELQTALDSFLKKGETLKLETKVDPSLIGGLVVDLGDKHIDMSISKKIRNITNAMKQSL
ncbi:predicted protein [Nematostella vectensis]|uniref:Oligomycin sensitivity conferral protein n=1 Tax=Nematostella vectensis TaxID=45351 RepID=A7RV43_NEMVE|nr:predicted protein [Nematostella vectensis]|eukprot:XP_001636747.1 predicted protein [Nematostella vectensis]